MVEKKIDKNFMMTPEKNRSEKSIMSLEDLQEIVLQKLDMTRDIEDEELIELIYGILDNESKITYMTLNDKIKLGKELFNTFRKLDLLQELLEKEEITEIMINGTDNIFIEKDGKISQSDKKFISKDKLSDVIQTMVASVNRMVNEATPIVDTRLFDGSRVNIVLPPVALNGPIVTIRKFPKDFITMQSLVELNSITEEVKSFLIMLVKAKYNIFISGGTGSGKTTFLNALSQHIPKDERIITIEDSAELQIRGISNLVSLETRNANVEGAGMISIRDLIKSSLRMRPDRIIVGEVRGEEAIDMLQALNTGHDGSLSTGHANGTKDMLSRLEMMVIMGNDIPLMAIRSQISAGLDIIVQLGRMRDKSRKVLEISEVMGMSNGEIVLEKIYIFEETGEENEKIKGEWKKVGELKNKEKLLRAGY